MRDSPPMIFRQVGCDVAPLTSSSASIPLSRTYTRQGRTGQSRVLRSTTTMQGTTMAQATRVVHPRSAGSPQSMVGSGKGRSLLTSMLSKTLESTSISCNEWKAKFNLHDASYPSLLVADDCAPS